MTPDGGHSRVEAAVRAREAARRQAPALSGAMPALVSMAVVLVLMAAVLVLDYAFDLDPHRVVKVAIAMGAFGLIVVVPKFGLLLLPPVAPFLPWLPPTPLPGLNVINMLLFSIFGTFAAGKILRRQPLVPENRLGGMLVLLIVMCALSVVRGAAFPTGYSYDAFFAATNVFRSATTFATYFIVLAMVRGPRERRRIWFAVMIGLLAESVVTVLYGRSGKGGRAVGSIGQANDLGGFLALYAVPALAGIFGLRSRFGKVFLLGLFGVASLALIMSLSRGSMLALVAGVLLVAWLSSRWAVAVLLLALLLSPVWAPSYLKDRIASSTVEVDGSDQTTVDQASEARLQTWQSILEVVQNHALDGVGFTGLGYILPDIGEGLGLEEVKDSAHNTYLRMLSELGIFGLIVFVWILWKCWALGWEAMKRARGRFDRSLGVGLCGATLALAINCAFGDRFFDVVTVSSYWVLCGLAENSLREPEGA